MIHTIGPFFIPIMIYCFLSCPSTNVYRRHSLDWMYDQMSVEIPLRLVLYCYLNMPTVNKTYLILSYDGMHACRSDINICHPITLLCFDQFKKNLMRLFIKSYGLRVYKYFDDFNFLLFQSLRTIFHEK